jgi:putative oxidoreductase
VETLSQSHYLFAALLARVFLGCLFFFQGYDAVFKVRIRNVIDTFEADFSRKGIPRFLTVFAAWFTSCTELVGGGLLIIGLFEYLALYLLGINLIIAAIGFGINTPVWNTRHVFPRLVLILFLLVIPQSWDTISLDHLLTPKL